MEIRLKIEHDMAKADEIKLLERLEDAYRQYSPNYLGALFSPTFVGWASKRIKDDFPLNVMEYINDQEATNVIQSLRTMLEHKESTIDAINLEVRHQKGTIDGLQRTVIDKDEQFLEMSSRNTQQANSLTDLHEEMSQDNDELRTVIYKLKARVFDLTQNLDDEKRTE